MTAKDAGCAVMHVCRTAQRRTCASLTGAQLRRVFPPSALRLRRCAQAVRGVPVAARADRLPCPRGLRSDGEASSVFDLALACGLHVLSQVVISAVALVASQILCASDSGSPTRPDL